MNITLRKQSRHCSRCRCRRYSPNQHRQDPCSPGRVPGQKPSWLPRLLYDSRHFFQALLRAVHAWQLHALLVLIGHLDGQVLEEPRVVLDFWNGYSLHEAIVEYKKLLKSDATCSQHVELFDEMYLLRISDKYARQQMSAFH